MRQRIFSIITLCIIFALAIGNSIAQSTYSNDLCPDPPQGVTYIRSYIAVGNTVTGTLPQNRLREAATIDAPLLAEIPNGETMTVITGPSCDDLGIVWWQVRYGDVVGWTAEGQNTERYLVPQSPDALPALIPLTVDNAAQMQQLRTIEGNLAPHIAWSPDGTQLAIAGARGSGSVSVYDMRDLVRPQYIPHNQNASTIGFHPNGQQLLGGTFTGMFHLWNAFSGASSTEALAIQTHVSNIRAVAISADGTTIAVAGQDALDNDGDDFAIVLLDTSSNIAFAVLDWHTSPVTSIALSGDRRRLISADSSGLVLVWDIPSRTPTAIPEAQATVVAISPNGQFWAAGGRDGQIQLFDAATNENIATLGGHLREVTTLSFSADSSILASGSADGTLRLWSTQSDANLGVWEIDENGVRDVAVSSNNALIAVVGRDARMQLFGIAAE